MSSLQEHAVARADADNESTFSQPVKRLSKEFPAPLMLATFSLK